MSDSNNIRIAKNFITDAINETREIIQKLEFYREHIAMVEDYEDRLDCKIDGHVEMVKFKLSKSKQWYMAEKKIQDAENFKGSGI